jgi:Zn-dependent protease with chaperone function
MIGTFLLLLGLAGVPAGVHAASGVITQADEVRIGKDASAEFEQSVTLSSDPTLTAKVRRIGRRLAAVSDRPGLPFQFKVVDTPEVNAVAFPGGFIYIFQGLIDIMPTDDALAAIIGHEITHATHRHWAKGTERDWIASVASLALHTPLANLGALAGRTLLSLDYSRHAEAEADRVGFGYLARAGYDPHGAVQAWEAMMKFSPTKKKTAAILRTHPVDTSRLQTLRKLADEAEKDRPQPRPLEVRKVDLAGPEPAPGSPWMPLPPGAQWTYRSSGPSGQVQRTEWKVTGRVPESPGAVRLALRMPGDVTLRPQARVTADGLELRLRPNDPSSEWRLNTRLPASLDENEEVTVPAGTFRCVKVDKPVGEGGGKVTLWLARGVGVVKRAYEPDGLIEELESYSLPSPASLGSAQ